MKDRIQIWLDRKIFLTLKERMEKEANEEDPVLMELYLALEEASQNNSNLEPPEVKESHERQMKEDWSDIDTTTAEGYMDKIRAKEKEICGKCGKTFKIICVNCG